MTLRSGAVVLYGPQCRLQVILESKETDIDITEEILLFTEHKHNHWNMFLNTCDERTNI